MRFCRVEMVALPALLFGACSGHTPAAPSQTAPFVVSAVSIASPAVSVTKCPVTFDLPTTVHADVRQTGSYQFTYQVEVSDGSKGEPRTDGVYVNIPAPKTAVFADRPYQMTVRASVNGSIRMRVTAPNEVVSSDVPLSVTCLVK